MLKSITEIDPAIRLLTYSLFASRDTANPWAPTPVLMNLIWRMCTGSMTDTPPSPWFAT